LEIAILSDVKNQKMVRSKLKRENHHVVTRMPKNVKRVSLNVFGYKMQEKTVVKISKSLKRKLDRLKQHRRETYEDVIRRLVKSTSKSCQ